MSTKDFNKNGYTVVKNIIKKDLLNFITQYSLFDEMQDFKPDNNQVLGAHSKYADPMMETILMYLHPFMEKNTGLSLYPTYSYYRIYRYGDILYPHKDRESCEISSTLCFNYSYDDSKYSWPIFINNSSIQLYPGDMAIYRGIELEHWRNEFNFDKNAWHIQGFFHYVEKNGKYSEWKFDKRESVGQLKNKKYISYT